MPDWFTVLSIYGPLGLFAGGVCLFAWKIGWHVTYKLFGKEGVESRGEVGKWVDSEKEWRGKLTERIESQTTSLGNVALMIDETIKIGTTAKQQAAEGNKSLQHIDEILTDRTLMLTSTAHTVEQLKGVVLTHCEICKKVCVSEFPNIAADVVAHCDAIERKLKEPA